MMSWIVSVLGGGWTAWLRVALALAAVAALVGVGYRQGVLAERATWQAREIAAREAAAARARAAEQERQMAERRAVAIGDRLTEIQDQLELERRRTHDALRAATRGRACLDERAVRLLNAQSAAGGVPAVPDAAGGRPPAADPAAAAADPLVATDTDVAEWISAAIAAHDACRAQIGCWVAWYEGDPAACSLPAEP